MYLMMQQDEPNNYLICSGNKVSLRSIVEYVFAKLHVDMDKLVISQDLYRPADIQSIYGDPARAKAQLNWHYNYTFWQVLDMLIDEEIKNQTPS